MQSVGISFEVNIDTNSFRINDTRTNWAVNQSGQKDDIQRYFYSFIGSFVIAFTTFFVFYSQVYFNCYLLNVFICILWLAGGEQKGGLFVQISHDCLVIKNNGCSFNGSQNSAIQAIKTCCQVMVSVCTNQ